MSYARSKYPPDWEAISLRVKERAKWRCECDGVCGVNHRGRCKRRHGEMAFFSGGWRQRLSPLALTVAHLDYDTDADETRMLAMCEGCHLRYRTNRASRDLPG